ncbi:MAG: MoCo/4Fe-4S cofactor protein with predicted Tat translocation signal [Saprospiraceae bacterium]|jgi:MoCo/4Fe-4S cofactor protein with predicted Tat translocation signal
MAELKKYWKGIEELENNAEFKASSEKEFSEYVPIDDFLSKTEVSTSETNRRDFLKVLGFSVTAATLAACEAPVTKSIPFLNKPIDATPGIANYYASTFFDGMDYASILVKTREGRPIFITANKNSKVTPGGVNARVNSSLLSLYDSKRPKGPAKKIGGAWAKNLSWSAIDKEVGQGLRGVASKGGNITLLTNTIISPSSLEVINKFKATYAAQGAEVNHVTYDAISASGLLDANEKSFGKRVVPTYNFDQAKVIVSFGADFLATWMNTLSYATQYAAKRNPDGAWMNKHYQFETTLSMTGSNADVRAGLKPSQISNALTYLLSKVGGSVTAGNVSGTLKAKLDKAAKDLLNAKGQSIVIAGSNNEGVQILINAINEELTNYGKTIDLNKGTNIRKGSDMDFSELSSSMNAGKVDALLTIGINAAYVAADASGFNEGLSKVGLKISLGERLDEMGAASDYLCPNSHYLESWNDFEPVQGEYSLCQPVISHLFNTRQWQESLLTWSGEDSDFQGFVKQYWNKVVLSGVGQSWSDVLHDGVYSTNSAASSDLASNVSSLISGAVKKATVKGSEWEVEFYVKTGLGNGSQALNPWLQELPDPISKCTYDNYITMAPSDAMKLFVKEDTKDGRRDHLYIGEESPAKVASLTVGGKTVELPVLAQPGQAPGTVGVAVGYGASGTELFTREEWLGDLYVEDDNSQNTIGKNVYPMFTSNGTFENTVSSGVTLKFSEGKEYPMATTQTHHTMMGRKIVNETTLATYITEKGRAKEKHGYNEQLLIADSYGKDQKPEDLDLWEEQAIDLHHRWGLSIDLNTCTGCGSCVTSCNIENNVHVVGKDEIRRSREMHWMRIDRYYSTSTEEDEQITKTSQLSSIGDYQDAEVSDDEPTVVYQPVMCQHCNHASCETVCPVAATTHSDEGLNQMTYNRCIGTRYCANNCAYKVRRFNWFQYDGLNLPAFPDFAKVNPAADDLGRMVLNPDVVVRSRGVMEKCSMCVQRIQEGKLVAKKAGETVQDGLIETACSTVCPSNAIKFGDLNNESHVVNAESKQERAYILLEEVGTQPNVYYHTKIRNNNA